MRLDTRYLDTFLAVIEMGGISRAAEHLFVSQPAVSHRIKKFEEELDVQLFERQGKRLRPTPAARKLEKICRSYLNDLAAFRSELFSSGGRARETLRIGSVSGFGRYLLFPLLCSPDYSHIRLHLTYPLARDIFREIEEGHYKLGFTYHKKMSHLLDFKPVYREELVLIGPAARSYPQDELFDLNSYKNMPFITYEESDYVFGKWFDSIFDSQPRILSSLHHFEELEEVIALVARGDGFSILPDYTVEEELAKGRVEIMHPAGRRCFNQVYSVTPTSMSEDKTITQLIKQIKSLDRAMRNIKP
jgi:DNA-binding transcriptional LysR family regulator